MEQPESDHDPSDTVAFAILLILPQAFGAPRTSVPLSTLRTPQKAAVPLFADMQHTAAWQKTVHLRNLHIQAESAAAVYAAE